MIDKMIRYTFFLSLCFVSLVTSSDYYKNKMKLINNLTDNTRYNPSQIPLQNISHSLPIDATISIGNYIEVHEESQSVLLDLWLQFQWEDFLMTWNNSNYGNISSLRLDIGQIWHPIFKINFGTEQDHVVTDSNTQVQVSDDGTVFIHIIDSTSVRCFLDVAKFPFDQQSCELYIVPLNAYKHEAYFRNVSTDIKIIGEGQWDILSLGHVLGERSNIALLTFTFVIERRPSYYVTYIMLPIMATSLLNPVVFLIPANSGEKVSTAVTILLSYSVFLSVIGEMLAKNSTSISILSLYIVASQLMSGLYVLLCVIIVRRFNKLDQNVLMCPCIPKNNTVDDEIDGSNECNDQKSHKKSTYDAGKIDRICARVAFSLTITATIALSFFTLL